jgi:alcohol dehydrogenase class IV
VLIVTDPASTRHRAPARIADDLRRYDIEAEIFDGVHVEPTDDSMTRPSSTPARRARGTGSSPSAAGRRSTRPRRSNLLTTHPGELMDYLNKPIGSAKTPPGPLKPLVAVPTTAGTGSESTAVCILDILSMKVKSGISHWRLRPTLAVVDPLLTMTLPPEVTAASGMDIVCHALESYTARWYATFDRKQPEERVTYCGANPISDLWSEKAMTLIARSFRDAVHRGADDVSARTDMMLAATFAGMGFGNSGCTSRTPTPTRSPGWCKDYRPGGYPQDEAMVPHGQVGVADRAGGVPVLLRARPERHLRAAELLRPRAATGDDQREQLPSVLIALMRDIGIPNGIGGVGYTEGRRPGPRAGHDEAAAAARHLPEDADRGRHRRHPHQVRRELVGRMPIYVYRCGCGLRSSSSPRSTPTRRPARSAAPRPARSGRVQPRRSGATRA